ncbi:MAG: TolC family protein [Bacteroidales bacterium]|nr:TolC family protein [Bacteroidales bacterium]
MKILINITVLLVLAFTANYAQTLEYYFKIAAENNPGLQAKYKDFEAAMQRVPQVSTLPDPTLSFGYFISPAETRVGPQRARVSLTQMFPWFGTLKAQGDAASLMAEAKHQSFLEARNRLYYQVATAYYPLFELKTWKTIEQENIKILQSYKSFTSSRFKSGTGTMADVLRVEIMLNDASTSLTILDQKEKPLLTAFNKLLNRHETETVMAPESLTSDDLPDHFREDILLDSNPVIKELDLKIKSSEASVLAAQRQGFPKLGVGLDYVVVGERTDVAMSDNGKDVIMPMLSVSIPVFRRRYQASVKESQFIRESYSLQKEDYANSLTASYETTLFEVQQQKELLLLYDRQIKESGQVLDLLFRAYANAGVSFDEVLRMQQQILRYKKMRATAEVQYQSAIARLNYLTAKTYQ